MSPRRSAPSIARVLGTLSLVALAGFAAYLAGVALATGAFTAGSVYTSAREPVMYWVHTAATIVFACGLAWLIVSNLLRVPPPAQPASRPRRNDLKLVIDNPARGRTAGAPSRGSTPDDAEPDRKNKPTLH
jgi:hypothetical protein